MAAPTTRAGEATRTETVRVLSGVQPTGKLHLGNYFGALHQHLGLQHEHPGEAFYFIANYHALTTVQDAERLRGLLIRPGARVLAGALVVLLGIAGLVRVPFISEHLRLGLHSHH
jgi:hypothetical protein